MDFFFLILCICISLVVIGIQQRKEPFYGAINYGISTRMTSTIIPSQTDMQDTKYK